MINLQEITFFLIGKQIFSHIDPKEYVNWAVKLLENGYDSENIRILAGLDNSDTEDKLKYFQKSLDDLKIKVPADRNELLNDFVVRLANKAIEGSIKPREALTIMCDIVIASDYSNRFMQFMSLDEDIDYVSYTGSPLFNSGLQKDNTDSMIINEFKLFLQTDSLGLNFTELAFCNHCNNSMKPILKKKFSIFKSKRYNYFCCPICNSKDLIYGTTQEGKAMILNTIKKN